MATEDDMFAAAFSMEEDPPPAPLRPSQAFYPDRGVVTLDGPGEVIDMSEADAHVALRPPLSRTIGEDEEQKYLVWIKHRRDAVLAMSRNPIVRFVMHLDALMHPQDLARDAGTPSATDGGMLRMVKMLFPSDLPEDMSEEERHLLSTVDWATRPEVARQLVVPAWMLAAVREARTCLYREAPCFRRATEEALMTTPDFYAEFASLVKAVAWRNTYLGGKQTVLVSTQAGTGAEANHHVQEITCAWHVDGRGRIVLRSSESSRPRVIPDVRGPRVSLF